jgi:hypothetical protein
MVGANSLARNYLLIASMTLAALIGVAFEWHLWGLIFILPLGVAMIALGFMVSYYLNALIDSHHRATVLSFKGLAFNLGYGFISLLFALALRAYRDDGRPEEAFAQGLRFIPLWLLLTLILLAIVFWRHRALLCRKF